MQKEQIAAMASRVYQLRTERGWTQLDLTKKLGTYSSLVGKIEVGAFSALHLDLLIKMAEVFETTIEDVIGKELTAAS